MLTKFAKVNFESIILMLLLWVNSIIIHHILVIKSIVYFLLIRFLNMLMNNKFSKHFQYILSQIRKLNFYSIKIYIYTWNVMKIKIKKIQKFNIV